MTTAQYWLDLFTVATWQEFLNAGAKVSGFRESQWKLVQQMRKGDYLLGYLTGVSRWIAILQVTGDPYQDESPIWKADPYPCRVPVQIVTALTPETAVPVLDMRDQLSVFQGLKNPLLWSGSFRGSPRKWKEGDGKLVIDAVQQAERNPVSRPFKGSADAPSVPSTVGDVIIPEREDDSYSADKVAKESAHNEMQWLLLHMGSQMGLDVWVARNDKGRSWKGQKFSEIPRLVMSLPRQFDEATNRTIELIDVLWLQGNAIVAAFEIESTTSIYSGLLRMSDLISMQPNLHIALYIVVPDERRRNVIAEVNRPTFARLSPPMSEMCKLITFSSIREHYAKAGDHLRFMRPEFLDVITESCAVSGV